MAGTMSGAEPIEPLAESAHLAWIEAPRRCPDPDAPDTCMWYHRVWQYLRWLGVITTIRTNTEFLLAGIRDCAGTGQYPRVLVSATADYSMLAHIGCAYGLEHQAFEATVVDRCDTSLFLNRWYADRYRLPLVTAQADILDFQTERPFDLICSHNFVGRFSSEARRRLVGRWHDLLRSGGVVITTQRIRPRDHGRVTAYNEAQARTLATRVAALAREHPGVQVDPDQLGEAVYEYASRKGGYVIRSREEIADVFEQQGFEIHVADDGGPAERARDLPSSNAGPETYRLRIIARKR